MKYRMLIPLLAVFLIGCAAKNTEPVAPHNSSSLWNLQLGRDYAAQGRYELAKEHLLIALVSNSDPHMRGLLTHELKSIDAIIQTHR
jgi:Tfp pilus assembly protein PilF